MILFFGLIACDAPGNVESCIAKESGVWDWSADLPDGGFVGCYCGATSEAADYLPVGHARCVLVGACHGQVQDVNPWCEDPLFVAEREIPEALADELRETCGPLGVGDTCDSGR